MEISEQDLRAMVRDAIARHTPPVARPPVAQESSRPHASHSVLALVGGGDAGGRCLIEPSVACTHCGYCQSMGH